MELKCLFIPISTLIGIVFFGCSEQKRSDQDRQPNTLNYEVIISGAKNYPLDSLTDHISSCYQYYQEDGVGYFLYNDTESNRLLLYDYKTGYLAETIKLEKEGQNAIGRLQYASFLSPDTLVVKGESPFNLFLMNRKGEIFQKFSTLTEEGKLNSPWLALSDEQPPYYREGHITIAFNGIGTDRSKDAYKNNNNLLSFDLTKGSFEIAPSKFTSEYVGRFGYWTLRQNKMLYTPSIDGNGLVVSFAISDSVMLWNREKGMTKRFFAANSGILSVHPTSETTPASMEEMYRSDAQAAFYTAILADPWQKVYYRLALHSYQGRPEDVPPNDIAIKNLKPASITVLNQDFQVIAEEQLPAKTYYLFASFVSPDGLCISTNNTYNPEHREDLLSFTIFRLQKKEIP